MAAHVFSDSARAGTLLYDEDCGLCVASAAWLGRRVAPRDLRLLPLTAAPADQIVGAEVAGRDLAAALHFVAADGRVFAGARAVLAAGRLVPRWRFLARASDHRLGHAVLEPIYRWVAANRRTIGRRLGLPASCPMPTSAERPR
ncbi:MAG TPA: DUF393 domain-containing protein [Candidatus Limnocylindrales bacterium]|nr:DUF393 domain-containing protein [Candidatus Limnocylindrales bacterium]